MTNTIGGPPPVSYTQQQNQTSTVSGSDSTKNNSKAALNNETALNLPSSKKVNGEVATANASLQGISWEQLTDATGIMNLSVSTTAILTMLIEIMAEMRAESRKAGFQETENALEYGQSAAEAMKKTATLNMFADVGSGALQTAGGAMQMKQAGSAMTDAKAAKGINDKMAGLDDQSKEFKLLNNEVNSLNAMSAAKGQQGTAWSAMANGLGGLGSGVVKWLAAETQAEAEIDRALSSYSQSLAQMEQDFFRQLGDAIKSAVANQKAIDQAQHQAWTGINGV